MNRVISRVLRLTKRPESANFTRAYSLFTNSLRDELTSRQLPLFFDYLHPQPSHLLNLTLTDLFPTVGSSTKILGSLPSCTRLSHLPAGHHLVYFPPQVTLSELLPDGTDTLHTPGSPFNRRLWAGGSVRFSTTSRLLLDGSRAVCVEGIRNVIVKGPPGEEKIIVKIERQIDAVREGEAESDVRKRIWTTSEDVEAHTSIVENRDLVFMRDKTPVQLSQDKAGFSQASRIIKSPTDPEFRYRILPTKALLFRFSALTFNAHLIHLDKSYTQDVEGYRNLLVHGPLTLALLLTAFRRHLDGNGVTIREIDYKNLAPVYVDEELAICGKPKSTKDANAWDVWVEGRDGGLAVRGTVRFDKAE
ncbi:HotDog domain-containing protein [Aspergillus germanicus]